MKSGGIDYLHTTKHRIEKNDIIRNLDMSS